MRKNARLSIAAMIFNMHFSYHKSPIKLWWRRQVFRLRRFSPIWFILTIISILFLLIFVPNPFSARYTRIPRNQDVEWNNVNEILQIKEQVFS